MSSRVFQATTGHSPGNPQVCGLSDREITEGDWIMYLVCHGADARPEYQIKVTREEQIEKEYYNRRQRRKVTKKVYERDYGMDNGRRFRSVFNGWGTNPDTGKREKQFKWQEFAGLDSDGHTIDAEGENAMEVLARAACSDEELGLVPPKAESEIDQIIREENEAISAAMNAEMEAEAKLLDEMEDAKALGLTLEQYRRLVAERG